MRVLVAPDKFRGTLSAGAAADAIALGWRDTRPDDEVIQLPLADGGEGTLDVLAGALRAERRKERVTGPLGELIDASYGLVRRTAGALAIVELAAASGLASLPGGVRDPLRATTRGTGALILAACRAGAREVIVTLGGSASTDAGCGLAAACGVRLLDERAAPITDGGVGLLDLARIDLTTLDPAVGGASIVAATDVRNPLLGPSGAARVFAPQKGAAPEEVLELERALGHAAAVIERDVGLDVRELQGGGAAGGTGAGLVAFLGAHLRPGSEIVFDAVGFDRALAEADVVVTGEGRVDETSFDGKVVGSVLAAATQREMPVAIICGEAAVGAPGGVVLRSLVERVGFERALGDARGALADLASAVAREMPPVSSRG
jgi:glycerate 2-kinase